MATKVQSKTYFPGYCSMRDPNNNVCNGMWDLYREDKASENSQFYDSFLARPAIGGYVGYAKEQMRQTILKQESTFRHQLQELHRLYNRQRDLMNECSRKELHNQLITAEASKSTRFLCQGPSENPKEAQDVSNFPLVHSTSVPVSTSGIDCIQSPLSFVKGNSTFKECRSLKSKCCTSERRMFDLELPADMYVNNESNQQIKEINSIGLNSGYNGHPSRSTLCTKKTYNLADLNEPIEVDETSCSASVNYLNNSVDLNGEIQRRDVSVNPNSGFWSSSQFSQIFPVQRAGGACLNDWHSESERNRKEQLTQNITPDVHFSGKTITHDQAYCNGIYPNHSLGLSNSMHVEPRKALDRLAFPVSDKSKAEPPRKRTIFGVEICEGKHELSYGASHTPSFRTSNPQPDIINSESSFVLPRMKTPSQNVLAFNDNHRLDSFNPSNGNPNALRQFPESFGGKMSVNSNSRSITSSGAGFSYQNGGPSSIAVGFSSGIISKNSVTGTIESPCMFPKEVDHQQNSESTNRQSKYENQESGLPWLVAKPCSVVEQIKEKEVIYQMNLDSLQNHSQQFFKKAEITKVASQILAQDSTSLACARQPEHRKHEIDDVQSVTKILGFPINNVPVISEDLISPSCPSRTHDHSSYADDETIMEDCAHDSKSATHHDIKNSVIKSGLDNYVSGLRHQIDLNLSLSEEESPTAPSIPNAIMKIAAAEIDLEAPAVLEPEVGISMEPNSQEIKLSTPSTDLREELVKVAAEAIMAISSSKVDDTCQSLDVSLPSDLLMWFAEVISSDVGSKGLIAVDDTGDEESIPEGMDYFELMTLKLKDTKVEDHCYKPIVLENEKDEATPLLRRARKGQGRRCRQRKDFQKDILPSLVSLSRREVTEDLQTFEEAFAVMGVAWQSSLSKRKAAKNTRGRKRLVGPDPPPTVNAVSPVPQVQQQPVVHREVALEEKSLGGWGKRTRRLPRQRCPNGGNNNHTLALKC